MSARELSAKTVGIQQKDVVFNYFHTDCIEGTETYKSSNTSPISPIKVAKMMASNNIFLPNIIFKHGLKLDLSPKIVSNRNIREASCSDYIGSCFKSENMSFSRCMFKSQGVQKNYLSDVIILAIGHMYYSKNIKRVSEFKNC